MNKKHAVSCETIAEHFGINKSTVSRALSGKGNMRPETRNQIIRYAKEIGYISESAEDGFTTGNIGVIIPRNLLHFSLYFHSCLTGIVEALAKRSYNVILILEEENGTEALEQLVEKQKCDGYILLQTYPDDRQIKYLTREKKLFVCVGSSDDDCYQIDSDITLAAKELVTELFSRGLKRIGYIGGKQSYMVNRRRLKGYELASFESLIEIDRNLIYTDVTNDQLMNDAIHGLIGEGCDCIICGDDLLADAAANQLTMEGISIPRGMKLAALFDSHYTQSSLTPITAVNVEPMKLGILAGEKMLDLIYGVRISKKTRAGYTICYRKSTDQRR